MDACYFSEFDAFCSKYPALRQAKTLEKKGCNELPWTSLMPQFAQKHHELMLLALEKQKASFSSNVTQ